MRRLRCHIVHHNASTQHAAFGVFKSFGNSCFPRHSGRFIIGDRTVIFVSLKMFVLNIFFKIGHGKLACVFRRG